MCRASPKPSFKVRHRGQKVVEEEEEEQEEQQEEQEEMEVALLDNGHQRGNMRLVRCPRATSSKW